MIYEVLYFDGDGMVPAYYLISEVEGDTPEKALVNNLERVTREVREVFGLFTNDIPDVKIWEAIYVVRADGLMPARQVVPLSVT
jgi:hypothetical protein